jgi:ABC-type glutathione transport system ATPase component
VSLDSLPFTAVDLPMPDPFVALIFIGCTQPGLRTARTRNPGQFLTLSDRHWTLETRSWKLTTVALVEVRNLTKTFPLGESIWGGSAKGEVRAVDDVSLDIHRGETLGLVGESGSGKSTLGRLILRLIEPTSGSVRFDESLDVLSASAAGLRRLRRDMQIIFQDPFGSLDPRMKVADVLAEPAVIHRAQVGRNQPAPLTPAELLRAVGMDESALSRFPHEFSGGQRQRIGIARALALRPRFIVADEPVSALDVSVGAQIINLMAQLQREFGLTYLFISHSMPVVRYLATRIAVMYRGKLVEVGSTEQIMTLPSHAYTRSLLAATPELAESMKSEVRNQN